MTFPSDNWAGAAPAVTAALAEASHGLAPAYGTDPLTEACRHALCAWFETDEVWPLYVATGSAANSVALASASRPGAKVVCHADSHIARDEMGAPAVFAPGQMLLTVDGPAGKIALDELHHAIAGHTDKRLGVLTALSLTNINEIGQPYTPAETTALAGVAREAGMMVHLDGARLANAVVETGARPADLTWRAGVDVVSLGFTKTGAWCAEAAVFFSRERYEAAVDRHKAAAQQMSKNRFIAAQFLALLQDNHVLDLAGHANAMARDLGAVLARSPEAALALPVASNEVFAFLAPTAVARLEAAGILFAPWFLMSRDRPSAPDPSWQLRRFVTSFASTPADIAQAEAALIG